MMPRFSIVYFVVGSLWGCDDGRGSFNQTYSTAVCERVNECAPGVIDAVFGSEQECQGSVVNRYAQYQADEMCTFDVEASEDCLSQTYRVSCEAWLEYGEPVSCESVYTCSSKADSGSPLLHAAE